MNASICDILSGLHDAGIVLGSRFEHVELEGIALAANGEWPSNTFVISLSIARDPWRLSNELLRFLPRH
ncbi:MAG: hypothetical protein ACI9G1_000366 [Pirellulaceae bacterium]|jgi:hypothetical protein